ncbi:MAG TPA: HAMP domain-containing sensor histidine kinase [Bryobacteraceae bacterium]|nr:HAMP domain-containing sensor histidine kinase [Bryobacteraceae bacterium]
MPKTRRKEAASESTPGVDGKVVPIGPADSAPRNTESRAPKDSSEEPASTQSVSDSSRDSINALQEEFTRQKSIAASKRLSVSLIHDLRSPISAIYAAAEMLIISDPTSAHAKRLASTIHRASRRVEELFQELMSTSLGGLEASQNCKLIDVIGGAVKQIREAADSQGVHIEIVAPDSIQLSLERRRMERVFLNIMNNALESMPEGGCLRVLAALRSDDVVIEIDDTGSGVPDHLRSSLFQPFVSWGKQNGVGLGLTLSRQTVVERGGDLWLGEKAGSGALFCLRLPLQATCSPVISPVGGPEQVLQEFEAARPESKNRHCLA